MRVYIYICMYKGIEVNEVYRKRVGRGAKWRSELYGKVLGAKEREA